MYKLKKKYINNLLDYQHFLKNNNLKKNKLKLKNNLFQNSIFLEDNDLICIEFNKYKNHFLPSLEKKKKIIYTIKTQYENNFLFNYHLNYNLLYFFTKILLNQKKKNIIKGRLVNGYYKKVFISFFGLIFLIKSKNLHRNKKIFRRSNLKIKKALSSYKLKRINFKIEKNFFKRSFFSRKTYVQEIIEKNKINFKKKK